MFWICLCVLIMILVCRVRLIYIYVWFNFVYSFVQLCYTKLCSKVRSTTYPSDTSNLRDYKKFQ
jgi:hypothetical protein